MSLPYVSVGPTHSPKALVVWLHGLGASGHDFEPIVPLLGLPEVRFVFPHAPARPVTINGGYIMPAWYDIYHLGDAPGREDPVQLQESASQVDTLISELTHDSPEIPVIIVGFSQGGAVAMELLTRSSRRFLSGMILSSYMVEHEQPWSSANLQTEVWFAHGTADGVVPARRGQAALETWLSHGRHGKWSTYPMGHEVCQDQITDLREWLFQALRPR